MICGVKGSWAPNKPFGTLWPQTNPNAAYHREIRTLALRCGILTYDYLAYVLLDPHNLRPEGRVDEVSSLTQHHPRGRVGRRPWQVRALAC